MEGHEIRLLKAEEIECRAGTVSEKGLSLLLFKDARVDQKILDEAFTPFGWRRTHQSIEGNLYCTVEVWDSTKGQWVAKQDVGVSGYSEKEKSQASDSFKRACFNWGIGRELYTAPFIWIPAQKAEICKRGEKYITKSTFKVKSIEYNSQRGISGLVITDGYGNTVFEMKEGKSRSGKSRELMQGPQEGQKGMELTGKQVEILEKELERTGVSLEAVLERYSLKELGEMTQEIYKKAVSGLKRTKPKEAA